jgi:hypothetical protein
MSRRLLAREGKTTHLRARKRGARGGTGGSPRVSPPARPRTVATWNNRRETPYRVSSSSAWSSHDVLETAAVLETWQRETGPDARVFETHIRLLDGIDQVAVDPDPSESRARERCTWALMVGRQDARARAQTPRRWRGVLPTARRGAPETRPVSPPLRVDICDRILINTRGHRSNDSRISSSSQRLTSPRNTEVTCP